MAPKGSANFRTGNSSGCNLVVLVLLLLLLPACVAGGFLQTGSFRPLTSMHPEGQETCGWSGHVSGQVVRSGTTWILITFMFMTRSCQQCKLQGRCVLPSCRQRRAKSGASIDNSDRNHARRSVTDLRKFVLLNAAKTAIYFCTKPIKASLRTN